jgi:hypothetical protein
MTIQKLAVQHNATYAYNMRAMLYRNWCLDSETPVLKPDAPMQNFSLLPLNLRNESEKLAFKTFSVIFPFDPSQVASFICAESPSYIALAFSGAGSDGNGAAHAAAAWYNGTMVAYFEPNYGEFIFPTVDEFREAFLFIMSLAADQNLDYKQMRDECGVFRFG